MDHIFARYILQEADATPQMSPSPTKPQKQDPQMEIPGADKSLQPPDTPPDFTSDQDPNSAQGGGDTSSQDPNTAGGDHTAQEGDPNAAGGDMDQTAVNPAGMGGPIIQSPEAQIDQDEKDVFSDLKPEQMIIMKAELRDNYKALHGLVVDTIEKINKISHTTYDDTMLDFIIRKLSGLKSQIRDTLIDTFSTRTYVSNKIELARFTFIFNQLTNMLTQIYQSRLKRQQKIAQLNKKTNLQHDVEEFPLFSRGYDTQ